MKCAVVSVTDSGPGTCLIESKSILDGKLYTREIRVDHNKLVDYAVNPTTKSIHEVFPELNADDREFILSGITPGIWNEIMRDDDE